MRHFSTFVRGPYNQIEREHDVGVEYPELTFQLKIETLEVELRVQRVSRCAT